MEFTEQGSAVSSRFLVEETFGRLGVPIAHQKTEGPATSLTFLGIRIDTVSYQLSLPPEKVERMQDLLQQWRDKKHFTRKQLESLVGHLCHAAMVLRPGRTFLHNLFMLLSKVSHPSHYVWRNLETRADLAWWQRLLQYWNGVSFSPSPSPTCHIYSDASGSFGCGAIQPIIGSWFQLQWPAAWDATGIAAKELVPIVVSALLWGCDWAGQHVCFHTDNEAVVAIIQKLSAKYPLLIQLLRCLFFYSSIFRFQFSALHIPGVQNTVADAISRNNLVLLSTLLPPQACKVTVPAAAVRFLLSLPDWGSQTWTKEFIRSLSLVLHHPPLRATAPVSVAT